MIQIKNEQNIDDASNGATAILDRILSTSDLPNIFLIHHAGKSPPGCSRSSGSRLRLRPDINRAVCKGNRINNKEVIKYKKAKANYIF